MVNCWNRFIYAFWSPVYDLLVNAPLLKHARRKAFDLLAINPGERVCLVGVGTGVDLQFLPQDTTAVGLDLSRAMLAKAKRKLPMPGRDISLELANAEDLPFPDASFDTVVLTLIVSVSADGQACLREAVRVTRPGGRLLVFDKFLPANTAPSLVRRLLNLLTRPFGTNINRSFEPMISDLPVCIVKDEKVIFSGAYRAIILEKISSSMSRSSSHSIPKKT